LHDLLADGAGLGAVVDTYNSTVASLENRLLVSARKIGELGARSDKDVPEPTLLDQRPRELTRALSESER